MTQNNRERTGSFFTPKIWADTSQEYLAKAFGDIWQDEYYIWDCAAGTGNLLAGLSNEYNIWASDIDEGNVETIQSLIDIDENLNLLSGHVFQFDFLNDSFDKLPNILQDIINNKEKRRKLIVYINPPYAEGDARVGKGRKGVALSKIQEQYSKALGYTKRELYIQFLARIYFELPDCKIAEFSTLTGLTGTKFSEFRSFFKAKLMSCFMICANIFDNVKGKFPIAFKIWNTEQKEIFSQIKADVFEKNGNYLGEKTIYAYNNEKFINDWVKTFRDTKWINYKDQFLYPNDGWKSDEEFKIECLVYTLFGGKNFFSANDGVNQWIPFTEKQVGTKEKFDSNFMTGFLKGKAVSTESRAVLDAGLELWKYYHAKIKDNRTVPVNASFYDIREFFQGRNEKGAMKSISEDEMYNTLISTLRENIKILTQKIQPKVYEYRFLKE